MCLRGRGGPQAAQTVKNNNNNNNYNEVFPAETVKCWWMCQEQPEEDEQQRPQSDDEVWMCQTDSLSLLLRVKRGSPPSAAGRERERGCSADGSSKRRDAFWVVLLPDCTAVCVCVRHIYAETCLHFQMPEARSQTWHAHTLHPSLSHCDMYTDTHLLN